MISAVCLEEAKTDKNIDNWKLLIGIIHAVMEQVKKFPIQTWFHLWPNFKDIHCEQIWMWFYVEVP
jgi:hypothetical protein